MSETLIDTGPLVAYLDRSDQHHGWAKDEFVRFTRPLLVCDAVLTEACYLLPHPPAQFAIGEMLRRGILMPASLGSTDHARVFSLMEQYRNVPMSFADACVLQLAESNPHSQVFTVDSDFLIYRLDRSLPVPLLAPFG